MRITFIGGGNMATAIIGGLVKRGFDAAGIGVAEIAPAARERLGRAFALRTFSAPGEAAPFGDLVVMAVKPQQMREAAQQVAPLLRGEPVLSIAAGIRLADLSRWLGGHKLLARCMPNTPALVGAGITAAYCVEQVTPEQRALVAQVLESVGALVWVEEEALLDAVTAVSGSGPAYVFYFIEALEEAARELGIAPEQARALALATFAGAARLAEESGEDVRLLRERVTSKGGTTEAALASMKAEAVKEAIVRAIRAADARARALGEQLGKDG
ncbi:MAG: pyrroline-5-carboxylate reductase [Betaproteobacteria bacterium]|nr:pyrroline-5-carboxylate reductase [Betaproteobacteria bacterium]